MKKKIYLLLLALPLIVGCGSLSKEKKDRKIVGFSDEIYIVDVEGHKYVIYDGYYQGGIVHAESCWCKETKKEDEE